MQGNWLGPGSLPGFFIGGVTCLKSFANWPSWSEGYSLSGGSKPTVMRPRRKGATRRALLLFHRASRWWRRCEWRRRLRYLRTNAFGVFAEARTPKALVSRILIFSGLNGLLSRRRALRQGLKCLPRRSRRTIRAGRPRDCHQLTRRYSPVNPREATQNNAASRARKGWHG